MKNHNYRHGDVAIKQIDKLPSGLTKEKGTTLARGEKTGHHHTLVAEKPKTKIQLFKDAQGQMYVEVSGAEAQLTHQEHHTITVMPGIYVVGSEREYDVLEGYRKVMD